MDREHSSEEASRLNELGYREFKTGDTASARDLHARGLERAEEAHDPIAIAVSLAGLMRVALRNQGFERLRALVSEGEAVAHQSGDASLLRYPLHMNAERLRMQGSLDEARQAYGASIELNESLEDGHMVAVEYANLTWLEIECGNLAAAQTLLSESEGGIPADDSYGQAFVLLTKARIRLETGDPTGSNLLDEADRILESAGVAWDPAEEAPYYDTRALTKPRCS